MLLAIHLNIASTICYYICRQRAAKLLLFLYAAAADLIFGEVIKTYCSFKVLKNHQIYFAPKWKKSEQSIISASRFSYENL